MFSIRQNWQNRLIEDYSANRDLKKICLLASLMSGCSPFFEWSDICSLIWSWASIASSSQYAGPWGHYANFARLAGPFFTCARLLFRSSDRPLGIVRWKCSFLEFPGCAGAQNALVGTHKFRKVKYMIYCIISQSRKMRQWKQASKIF